MSRLRSGRQHVVWFCSWCWLDVYQQSFHGDWRCLFPACFPLLCLLNSYIFPLVLNMHFAFLTHGKWACYVACKCSHTHQLLSIFQQGLTNVIVFLPPPPPLFPGHLIHELEFKGESWFPGSSMPTLLPSLSHGFLRDPQLRLEHGIQRESWAGLSSVPLSSAKLSLISKLHRPFLITLMALAEDWHFLSS